LPNAAVNQSRHTRSIENCSVCVLTAPFHLGASSSSRGNYSQVADVASYRCHHRRHVTSRSTHKNILFHLFTKRSL